MDTVEGLAPKKFPEFNFSYPVIVMELLDGGDMFRHIVSRKNVSENYLSGVFRSVILALRSIHERGYIHRDLKLSNLMLVGPGESRKVKVIDFG